MTEENRSERRVFGGPGITAGENVTIGDVSGQFAAGENINQYQSIAKNDLKELREHLIEFQTGIHKLGLEPEDQSIVNGDISSAIKEAKKENPESSTIKEKFESAVKTIKEAGKTISNISELFEPAKKIANLFGIASILV
jgi:hypothetical protein